MKTLLMMFLVASSVIAQDQAQERRLAPSCGPEQVKFDVKTEKHPPAMAQPDPGKARVYFIEDNSSFQSAPRPTTRAGVDGEWVGAARGNSYFFFSVDPGEHHLCASWQTWVGPGVDVAHKTAAAHFTAVSGGVYYFRVTNFFIRDLHRPPTIKLELLDSDEGQLLTNTYALSTFQQKK